MPLQRNEFIPQNMLTVYTSASGMTDIRTNQPYVMGGLYPGVYFDLTEAEAQAQSTTLHEGRYRYVQIDSSATSSNIKTGTVGLMKSVALGVNFITSYDKGLSPNVRPIIFINSPSSTQIAAGCWIFVQEQGIVLVDAKASLANGSPAVGDVINSSTSGLVDDPSTQTSVGPLYLGTALQLPTGGGQFLMLLDAPQVQG